MHRLFLLAILMIVAAVLFDQCGGESFRLAGGYAQVRHLAAENQELRQRNSDLAGLQDRTLSELEKVRRTADQADLDLKVSYLSYTPFVIVMITLGGGLAATCILIIRRRRSGG